MNRLTKQTSTKQKPDIMTEEIRLSEFQLKFDDCCPTTDDLIRIHL